MKLKKLSALLLAGAMCLSIAACSSSSGGGESEAPESAAPATTEGTETTASDLNVGVFYYTYSDVYITSVRTALDAALDGMGITYQDYDGNNTQSNQLDQVNTAISNGANLLIVNIVETSSPDAAQTVCDAASTAGIPVIFFNREVDDSVINSYDNAAFVGTDAAEAGHMQGEMIANYLTENYDTVDLNGDGTISYVMFKGQEGNAEAEYRTQYAVEDADALLEEAGHPALSFYDPANTSKYLVDQNGSWSAAAATNYMDTILSAYSEANGNMVELVIANNDEMAKGAISSLQAAGYNTGAEGSKTIPVFGVDATEDAQALINQGLMTGSIKQDAEGMANTIATLVGNINAGEELMANTDQFIVDEGVAKIRVPYAMYTGEESA